MKSTINKLLVLCVGVLLFASCEDFLGGDDFNVNPNKPASVPVSAQLPEIGIQTADLYGGAYSRFNCMLSQQVEGVARQWRSMNQYTGLTPNRFDAAWSNTYENILIELKIAQEVSRENGYNHYLGIFNTLEAFNLMNSTDVWDAIPLTQALNGVGELNPAYDGQDVVYGVINAKLDEAISLFQGDAGSLAPGGDDVYFGGDAAAWLKAARALKARGLVKTGSMSEAASLAASSFDGAADNLAFQYPDANNAGQWFRFNRDRTGDIEFHPQFAELLTGLADTVRLKVMNPTFITDHPYMTPDFNQELVTYREMQFIIAEANLDNATGYEAYRSGIRASFARFGLTEADFTTYFSNPDVDPGTGNLTMELVMTQKYIAMYLQPEVYSDWRRTNIPSLTPVTGTAIPVRWHYSSDEYLFNTSAPNQADINIFTGKVGWDN